MNVEVGAVNLSQGIVLVEDSWGDDTFVTIPEQECGNLEWLQHELADRGLEMIDPDESEPEVTPEGLRIWLVQREGLAS